MEQAMDDTLLNDGPLLTRKQLVEHINQELGIPLKLSSFMKLQMKKESRLEPDAFYGKCELFKPSRGAEWALQRLATKPTDLELD